MQTNCLVYLILSYTQNINAQMTQKKHDARMTSWKPFFRFFSKVCGVSDGRKKSQFESKRKNNVFENKTINFLKQQNIQT